MKTFTITDEDWESIEKWQDYHTEEKHSDLPAGGAIGGRFSYEFTPTTVGMVGICKCCCGDSFIFSEI